MEDRVLLCGCCDPVPNTIPAIANLTVETVDDGTAYGLNFVTADIVDDTRDSLYYTVQLDFGFDGTFEVDQQHGYSSSAETFAFLLPYLARTGTVAVNVLEWTGGVGSVSSGFSNYSFDLDLADNKAPELIHRTIDFASGYGPNSGYATIYGKFRDFTPLGTYSVQIDDDGDGDPDGGRTFDRGRFSFQLYIWPGPVKIRVVESKSLADGSISTTGWQSLNPGGPADPNVAPEFPPSGDYSATRSYGALSADPPPDVPGATAEDLNNDQLRYSVNQPIPYDMGNGWYKKVPTLAVSIDESSGDISITNPEAIQNSFEQFGKFSFTVEASDGMAPKATHVFAIYDDYNYWIAESDDYIEAWQEQMHNLITDTKSNTRTALFSLNSFLGSSWDMFSGTSSVINSLSWIVFPGASGAAKTAKAVGEVGIDALITAYNNEGQNGVAAIILEFDRISNEVRDQDRDDIDAAVTQLNQQINVLDSKLSTGIWSTWPLDAKALKAYQKFESIRNGHPLPEFDDIPKSDDIYAQLLLSYAQSQGWSIFGSCDALETYGDYWDTNDDTDIPVIIDATDIVDELNRLEYYPGESYPDQSSSSLIMVAGPTALENGNRGAAQIELDDNQIEVKPSPWAESLQRTNKKRERTDGRPFVGSQAPVREHALRHFAVANYESIVDSELLGLTSITVSTSLSDDVRPLTFHIEEPLQSIIDTLFSDYDLNEELLKVNG